MIIILNSLLIECKILALGYSGIDDNMHKVSINIKVYFTKDTVPVIFLLTRCIINVLNTIL